ncbi:Uncharacterized protein APZ42_010914 [Daphnia magna]|uniref:Uncharacterized protein n=1 Tax=Daphnia magna TaxID=35525 RepID=A0A162T9E0_9CRUS|nr:Uncharacterized protein APZ42_010914 [Daphnia magna]
MTQPFLTKRYESPEPWYSYCSLVIDTTGTTPHVIDTTWFTGLVDL